MKVAPEDTVDEMASQDVKHNKDQLPNAGTPHVRNHHVGQQGGVPGLFLCIFVEGQSAHLVPSEY